ncbi:hypothetical protein AAKU55_005307 [Oxalobacteraceae bacterium GrIS 1.11]
MRATTFLLFVLGCLAFGATKANPGRTPVYDDAFVWHVASQLSRNLVAFQKQNGFNFPESDWIELGSEYDILYHNYLLRCDGPLLELEKMVAHVEFESLQEAGIYNAAGYDAALNNEAWSALQSWAGKILLPFIETLSSSKFGFYPECVVPAYLAKNKISIREPFKAPQINNLAAGPLY